MLTINFQFPFLTSAGTIKTLKYVAGTCSDLQQLKNNNLKKTPRYSLLGAGNFLVKKAFLKIVDQEIQFGASIYGD